MTRSHERFAAVSDSRNDEQIILVSEDSCEAFHIPTQTWESLPSTETERSDCAAVCHEGTVFVVGGDHYFCNELPTAECMKLDNDPTEDCLWQSLPSMEYCRSEFATVLVNDRIIAIGGGDGECNALKSAEAFDLKTKTWFRLADMQQDRSSFAAATVDGKVYVFGGCCGNDAILKSAESYNTFTNTWEPLPDMPSARVHGAAIAIGQYILLIGGLGEIDDEAINRVDCFDTVSLRWIVTGSMPSLHTARWKCPVVRVGNQVFVIGGEDQDGRSLDTMERIEINPYFVDLPRLLPLMKEDDDGLPLGLWPQIMAGRVPSVLFSILSSDRFRLDSVLVQT